MKPKYIEGPEQKAYTRTLQARLRDPELTTELLRLQLELAQGIPQEKTLKDGSRSRPVLISPEVQERAIENLLNRSIGKAVPQTEVVKAEAASRDLERFDAMSDAELEAFIKEREALAAENPPLLEKATPAENPFERVIPKASSPAARLLKSLRGDEK